VPAGEKEKTMSARFEGTVAFVTGAAKGQGRAHALRLAREGADIIAVDYCEQLDEVPYPLATRADLERVEKEVEALDRRIVATVADVRDADALRAALDEGVATLGRLDMVFANAGIADSGLAPDLSGAAWRTMIDVNLTGVWNTCQAAIPHLLHQGAGTIVITSSIFGLKGMGAISHYAAAKHGVVGLMRSLANELGPQNIRVNAVNPTMANTDMIQNDHIRRLFLPDSETLAQDDFAAASQTLHVLPVPWIEAEDVTAAALFLASPEARYITGVTLPVDAGALIK
jgi:(+)-trans-carveol dehydrogenase